MSLKAPKIICILGMHRSGTSCLTGSLQLAGLYLGKHHTWNRHNQRGNRENPDIIALHETLLAENGGSWKSPPAQVLWSEQRLSQARQLIRENTEHSVWGFKDPRTLLTINGWKSLVPEIAFVGIYRHPAAVEHSLRARGSAIGLAGAEAFNLYHHYNQILVDEYRQKPFPILCFDWSEALLHQKVNEVTQRSGLNSLSPENRFFESGLRHHHSDLSQDIPADALAVYRSLQAIDMSREI